MNQQVYQSRVKAAAELLATARHAVALTGAGISTPSGIPDFRSQGTGLWERSNPMEVASLTAFRRRPQAFYNWLRPLARDMLAAKPNPAHTALAKAEQLGIIKAVITQNIDLLHQKAGSTNVIELHGSAGTLTCLQCHTKSDLTDFRASFIEEGQVPYCSRCNSVLKPDIILFEEMLPTDAWEMAGEHCEAADVLLIAGTSLEVVPASQLPLYTLQGGGAIIINNLSSTYLDAQAAVMLPYDVATTLPAIIKEIENN